MEEADRKRRDEFKTYEMEKKFEQHERLNHIEDEEKRKEEEKRMKEAVRNKGCPRALKVVDTKLGNPFYYFSYGSQERDR